MAVNESIPEFPSLGNSAVESPVLSYQGSSPSFPEGWTGTQVFGLPQQKWTPFFYRRIIQTLGASFAYTFPLLASNVINTQVNLVIGFLLAMLFAFTALAIGAVLDELKNYRIILSDQGLLLRAGWPVRDTVVLYDQITGFTEVPNGIYVRSKHLPQPLFIYSDLELFPGLRRRLNTIHPVIAVYHPALYALKIYGPRSFLLFTLLTSFMALGKLDPGNLQIASLIIVYVCAIIQLVMVLRSPSRPRWRRIVTIFASILLPLFASYMVCIFPHSAFTYHHYYAPKVRV